MTSETVFEEEKKDDGDRPVDSTSAHPSTKPNNDGSSSAPSSLSVSKDDDDDDDSANRLATRNQQTNNNDDKVKAKPSSKNNITKAPRPLLRLAGTLLRTLVIDFPLIMLFAALVSAVLLHKVHDDYLYKQLELMVFQDDGRDYFETMYYHRYCTGEEVSATTRSQLVIPKNATAEECAEHQMTHGVSIYQDLLTPETAHELREFIVEENKKQEGFFVIQNDFRYSWGIDINMHPSIKKYWKELASNKVLVQALQEIMGPDPAVIEFTAITAAYGAKDQHDHQDVVPTGSGAKFAHSFIPSYSLFITLQNTSYDMGATHVCPGSHLCSDGCDSDCHNHNLAMSGEDDNWPTGWGALVNQQTTHKGMGHAKEGGPDRVVIIATFAPRPQTFRGLETRIIGQGGSYSIKWNLWGHTFSDYVFAEQRMWEPLKSMRSLGLVKGGGWNLPTVASMRISNDDNGYSNKDALEEFHEEKGGFKFLPKAWQGEIENDDNDDESDDDSIENVWYLFLIGTLKRTEEGLAGLYKISLPLCLVTLLSLDLLHGLWTRRWSLPSIFLRGVLRLAVLHGIIALIAWWGMHTIDESNWAKDIASGKAFRLPAVESLFGDDGKYLHPATLPNEFDILRASHYASQNLAGYGRVMDFAHPGNVKWNELTRTYAHGYLTLTKELQKDFCQSLLDYMLQDARFLKHGEERAWLPIEDNEELSDICHQDLVAASSKKTAAMVRELNSLKMATQLGRFRETAMQRDIIPRYLNTFWEPLLVPRRQWSLQQRKTEPGSIFSLAKRNILTKVSSTKVVYQRRYSTPESSDPKEPFPLAWAREGDVVEAMFRCNSFHYYRATILAIVSTDSTFDIQYEDGDVDPSLKRHCLRPYVPYQIGDQAQVRTGSGEYKDGTILSIYANKEKSDDEEADDDDEEEESVLFDIELVEGRTILAGVYARDLRRFDNSSFKKGERVAVLMDDEEWHPGKILRANVDGTYYVRYFDDGERENSVTRARIRR